jgi:hypothetical protein
MRTRWFFEWRELADEVSDVRLRQVLARWRLPIPLYGDYPADDHDDGDDDDADDADDADDDADDGDAAEAADDSVPIILTFHVRIPPDVAAVHGVFARPENGRWFLATFDALARPHQGAHMDYEQTDDSAACRALLDKLGDEIANAFGGRIDAAEFERRLGPVTD